MAFDAVKESRLEPGPHGLVNRNEGWFVVNLSDAEWRRHEKFGEFCNFEGEARFTQLGINVHVLAPGQPNCHYHRENTQEDFLVLSGECLVLVEGEERRLKAWDFFHSPPGTAHVFVGAGNGPCAILMVGARRADEALEYPAEPLPKRYDASAPKTTSDPAESYAGLARSAPCRFTWPPAGSGR